MSNAVTRQTGANSSRLLALSLAWVSLAASAEVTVQVARQENAFTVEANLLVAVDQRIVWAVFAEKTGNRFLTAVT